MATKRIERTPLRTEKVGATLPSEYIRELKQKLDEDQALLAALPGRIEEARRLYEAALLFAPQGFGQSDAEAAAPKAKTAKRKIILVRARKRVQHAKPSRKPSWVSALMKTLITENRGMSHKELLLGARKIAPLLPLSTGEKAFYNAIAKLAERGELVKHGGLLYSGQYVQKLRESGRGLPVLPSEPPPRSGSSGEFVLAALRDHPSGLTAPALRNLLSQKPNAPKSLREHGQYVYNILSTQIGKGVVVKDGSIYRCSEKPRSEQEKAPAGSNLNGA